MEEIGVVIALYNGEKFILQQLESILNQSRKPDKVWLADDGSTDGTYRLVENWICEKKLQEKWFLSKNSQNFGHAKNFIELLKKTDTDYVFFSDQDDIWLPNKIESMVNQFKNNPQIDVLYADVINTGTPESFYKEPVTQKDTNAQIIEFSAENYFFKGLGCATCVRGSFVKEALKYWVDGWEHDMFFWACAQITDSAYYYPKVVICRRIHSDNASISVTKTRQKRLEQIAKSQERPLQLIKMMKDYRIKSDEKLSFLTCYYKSLKLRYNAISSRNVFLAGYIVFTKQKYYLHGFRGAVLDLLFTVLGDRPIRLH